MNNCDVFETFEILVENHKENYRRKKQAGAELSQAQPKLGL